MNAVIEPAKCVNSSTGQPLSARIAPLLHEGLSNCEIADTVACSPDYVRAVRHKLGLSAARPHRRVPKRLRQPNLRELALKLYAMRQEGLL